MRLVVRLLLRACLCVGLLSPSLPAPAQVVISEFMANNTRTLADEDGAFPDWIELQNLGTNTVPLLNWSLTDSANNLNQWRLPATNLASGEFLVVFASGKNRRNPGSPLHTSFKLSNSGDYLALVMPDGKTIATEFRPQFPPQLTDISYGFGTDVANLTLIPAGAPARFLVPLPGNGGDQLGDRWNGSSEPFADNTWSAGASGLGFFRTPTNLVAGVSLVARLNFSAPATNGLVLDSKPSGAARHGTNNGAIWIDYQADAASPVMGREGLMAFDGNRGGQVLLPAGTDLNLTRGSIAFWMRSSGNQGPGSGGAVIFDRRSTKGDLLALTDDGHLSVQATSAAGVVRNAFSSVRSIADGLWHQVVYSFDNSPTGFTALYIDGALDLSQPSTGAWTWDPARPLELGRSHDPFWRRFTGALDDFRVYKRLLTDSEVAQIYSGDGAPRSPVPATDVGASMFGLNSSVFVRIPFVVADPSSLSLLSLRMQYDDGFVAYINGMEVARDHAPDFPDWNAAALSPNDSKLPETFSFGDVARLLHPGTNILAIQALNIDLNDPDFFLAPELSAFSRGSLNPQPRYFLSATPGRPNLGGSADLGPIFSPAQHQPQVPADADDLLVTVQVVSAFRAVQAVTLNYRIGFGATNQVEMRDDGLHGDGASGDGFFGGVIPASASTNGQLIRYFVMAVDTAGASSRWPLFEDPLASEEYAGTVVTDPGLVTQLPVYQLFVRQPANMDSDTGTRATFFFNGDLYDNVLVRLKGGTTRGLNKKAHRVDFNRDHPFLFDPKEKPTRELALNAEFIDPSFLRQNTSFWLFNQAGTPAPIHFPVRLQLNGQFHELAFHTETMDNALVSRMGLNGEGALYKNALMLNIVPEPAIGNRDCLEAEKQTRLNEGYGDLIAWTSGIAETNSVDRRRAHLFDTTDIPSVINYLACFHLTQQGDGVHANVCPHRDTGVTDEWRLIPWDMNLSMGQVWAIDHISGTEDAVESHPFYGSSGWRDINIAWSYNRLFDSLIVVPELRQMYLRRLRTLSEEMLQAPGTPADQLKFEARILEMRRRIEPEALMDRIKWGWPQGYSGYAMTNVPFIQAVDELIHNYVQQRRTEFFAIHNVANTNYANRAGIPDSQPIFVPIRFGAIEVTPASGNPLEEFVELRNTNGIAVDVSGWSLSGGVSLVFKPGTVIPSGGSLYVSPDVKAFRSRLTSPTGREGRFVQGPYQGRLSARGESLALVDRCLRQVDTLQWPSSPTPAQAGLRITEIMFQPPAANLAGFAAEDFEFLELKNISTAALDLAGVRLTSGVSFDFTTASIRTLAPGGSVVVVKNLAAFRSRYGDAVPVAGVYVGSLSNEGDRLRLEDGAGEIILEFSYDPAWYPAVAGIGFSLVAVGEQAAPDQWGQPGQWRPSAQALGSPGAFNAGSAIPRIRINEILANPAGGPDLIELFNPTAAPVDIGGWYLTDDPVVPRKYRIPQSTVLAPGGYWVVDETRFNAASAGTNAFALDAAGEQVHLFSADAVGSLTGYSDGFAFGASAEGVTLGRWLDSTGQPVIGPLAQATLGAVNSGPRVAPVVISEVFYHGNDSQEEYLEIHNRSSAPVALYDAEHSLAPWRLRGDVDLDFPAGLTLPPDDTVVLVGFDPVQDSARSLAFRSARGIPQTALLLGPYQGVFQHGGGSLRLEQPGTGIFDVKLGVLVTPWIGVDEVRYLDQSPWPLLADGYGAALTRRSLEDYGNDPGNWIAAAPSPGSWSPPGIPPQIVTQPVGLAPVQGSGGVVLSVGAQSVDAPRYQWLFNGRSLPGATAADLSLPSVQLGQAGCYEAVVMNSGGAVRSAAAMVGVKLGPLLTLQPTNRVVPIGSNLVLRASAIGAGEVRYQWQFNGRDLAGATGSSLTLSNVQAVQSGSYRMRVMDDLGTAYSDSAAILAAVRSGIALAPQSTAVVAGDSAVFSVSAIGTPPLTFRWKRGALTLSTVTLNTSNSFLVITNVQAAQALGTYSVSVANVLGNSLTAPSFALSLLTDSDGDGIPDAWEVAHGLNAAVSDVGLDSDGDGVSNRDEYLADTDPKDAISQLALEIVIERGFPVLEFNARSNRTYTLQVSDALLGLAWQRLADVVALSSNRLERVADPSPAMGPRYYRLVTPWQ